MRDPFYTAPASSVPGAAIPVSDEGTQITAGATSMNFVGPGVTATASGNNVTVTVPGGGSTPVVNSLTSTSTTDALAAAAGKSLKDTADALAVTVAGKADTSSLGSAAFQPISAFATAAQGTDAREWTAATITQAEAEAGTATTRRAFTAERVRQAIAAWWTATTTAAGRALATAADAAAQRVALGLGTAATTASTDYAAASHTQAASTISDSTATGRAVLTAADAAAARTALGAQATLVSGTNIRTINGNSLLGSGDLTIAGGGGSSAGSANTLQMSDGAGGFSAATASATTPGLNLSGSISAAAWTTNGIGLREVARTLTDTSSSGTVAAAYTHVLGGNTLAASAATTYTNYATAFFADPTAGSNVTITSRWSVWAAGAVRGNRFAGNFGSAAAPTYAFEAFPNIGWYTGDGLLRASISGSLSFTIGQQFFQVGNLGDCTLTRAAPNTWQLGPANAAAPVAQTLRTQGPRPGTDTNTAGVTWTMFAGPSTGTATPNTINFQSTNVGSSGTAAQTLVDTFSIFNGCTRNRIVTVATLPASPALGDECRVSDASSPTWNATLTGGGAVLCGARWNGSNWVAF